jgi:hypothetical protein
MPLFIPVTTSSFMIPFRPRELTASIENVFVQTKSSKDYSDFCGGPMNAADFTACLPQDLPWLISFSLDDFAQIRLAFLGSQEAAMASATSR